MLGQEIQIEDQRQLPIFIHSEIDDLGLSPEAFRVYCHLVRRAGKNGQIFPTIASIGAKCFPGLNRTQTIRAGASSKRVLNIKVPAKSSQKRMVLNAISELELYGLIRHERRKKADGRQTSNRYILLDKANWKAPSLPGDLGSEFTGRSRQGLPGDPGPGLPGDPKGTPLSSLRFSNEGSPTKEELREKQKENFNPSVNSSDCEAKPLAQSSENPNPPKPPFPAQVAAIYNDRRPSQWVPLAGSTQNLERLLFKKLREGVTAEKLLDDMAAALRFVSEDKYWSAQIRDIHDLLRGDKLEEWSAKQRHIEAQSKNTSQASEDAAQRREIRLRQNQAQIDRNRLEEDVRNWWAENISAHPKHVALQQWMRFTKQERGRIFRTYEAKFLRNLEVSHA